MPESCTPKVGYSPYMMKTSSAFLKKSPALSKGKFKTGRKALVQFHLLVSALQFDFDEPDDQRYSLLSKDPATDVLYSKSMSLISLLKTVQSLFYLGKIVTPSKIVFNPKTSQTESSCLEFYYSWTKAFKMVLEHQFLSLYAFEE